MNPKCKTGKHTWTNPEDAAKCCNGYKRVLLLGKDARGQVRGHLDGTPYGFTWIKVEREDTEAAASSVGL